MYPVVLRDTGTWCVDACCMCGLLLSYSGPHPGTHYRAPGCPVCTGHAPTGGCGLCQLPLMMKCYVKVSYLLRQHSAGSYPLQRPYQAPPPEAPLRTREDTGEVCPASNRDPTLIHHQFIVQVGGVRELELGTSTVWGEADCFIQYHFPTQAEDSTSGEPSPPNPPSGLVLCMCVHRVVCASVSHQH